MQLLILCFSMQLPITRNRITAIDPCWSMQAVLRVSKDQIARIITEFLNGIRTDIRNYSRLPLREVRRIESLRFLESIWERYNLSVETGLRWQAILSEYLSSASEPIEVRPINQRTGAASLDYSAYAETGLRVIAVGGNSLSRGLTLEGLRVSYFYRNSRAYDTLMQMGRWFGYRSGYENLFKILDVAGCMRLVCLYLYGFKRIKR